MTEFNPKKLKSPTQGDLLGPAMEITSKEDANQYLDYYVEFIENKLIDSNREPSQALSIAKENLGYYAGYYSTEVRIRVEELFECKHPFFGSIAKNGIPTAKEAFEMGKSYAERKKDNPYAYVSQRS